MAIRLFTDDNRPNRTTDPGTERPGRQVTKGRISIVQTSEVWEFMFNPPTMRDQKGIAYPDQAVPGMSHPVTQYAGGGARVVSFELYLDGDRGRLGRDQAGQLRNEARPPRGGNFRAQDPDPPSKSIEAEILFLQSLQYPMATEGNGIPDIEPPRLLFTFGTLFDSMECVLEQCSVEVVYWNANLEPIRANIGMALKQVVDRSVARSDVYVSGAVR